MKKLAVVLASVLAVCYCAWAENLITNGSFEEVSGTLGTYGYCNTTATIPGWTIDGRIGVAIPQYKGTWYGGSGAYPDGTNVVFLQSANTTSRLRQSIEIPCKGIYRLSFAYAPRSGFKGQSISVSIGGSEAFHLAENNATGFVDVEVMVGLAQGTTELVIACNSSSDKASVFDNFVLEFVTDKLQHTFDASAGGSVSDTTIGADTDESVSVTATPDAGYEFVCWRGNFPAGTDTTSAILSFTVGNDPVSGHAYFRRISPWYVDGSAASEGDGSQASPFKTIATALSAVPDFNTIVLLPGTYSISSTIDMTRPLEIRGSTGDFNDVFIDAGHSRRAVEMGDAYSKLQNVTVARGSLGTCDNSPNSGGAGVHMTAGLLRNCRITNCKAGAYVRGGGVWNGGGTVENCVIDGNDGSSAAFSNVGGIGYYQQGASSSATGCVITNNFASSWHYGPGGGFNCAAGAWITGGTFSANLVAWNWYGKESYAKADWSGASYSAATGVYLSGGSVSNCRIVSNRITQVTGKYRKTPGLNWQGGTVTDTVVHDNLDVADNPIDVQGANAANVMELLAAQEQYPAHAENVRSVTITPEEAGSDLAAAIGPLEDGLTVNLTEGAYYLTSTLVVDKDVKIIGAGPDKTTITSLAKNFRLVELRGREKALLAGVTLTGGYCRGYNSPDGDYTNCGAGGDVWINAGGTVSNCVMTGVTFQRFAIGCIAGNDGGLMTHCVLHGVDFTAVADSTDIQYGGALTMMHDAVTEYCVVTNISFSNIHKDYPSAAVELRGGTLKNTLVADCHYSYRTASSSHSAAVRVGRTDAEWPRAVVNCTIADNEIISSGGSAGLYLGSATSVRNSIIARNTNAAGTITANHYYGSGSTFTSCCTTPVVGIPGSGNIDLPAVLFKSGTYELPAGSVLIAGGDDGSDIGAYSYVADSLTVVIATQSGASSAVDRFADTLIATPEGDVSGISYYWDLDGDSVYETAGSNEIDVDISSFGEISIGVKVVNGAGVVATAVMPISVMPSVMHVKAGNAGAAWPYATEATAASDIKAAIAAAVAGGRILVWPGSYPVVAEELEIDRPLKVESVFGPQSVVVYGSGSVRVFNLDGEGAVLSGITVSNGWSKVTGTNNNYNGYDVDNILAGGGVCVRNGACITNCVVGWCKGARLSAGLCVYSSDGKIYDSIIGYSTPAPGGSSGNSAIYYGALYQRGADAVCERTTIRDCTIELVHRSYNHRTSAGAMVLAGRFANCLLKNCNETDGVEGTDKYRAGGLLLCGGTAEHVTAAGCSAGTGAAGICVAGGALSNSIAWGNTNTANDTDRDIRVQSGTVTYTDSSATLAGTGNITVDPLFLDAANGDYRIHSVSPCAKAGLDKTYMGYFKPGAAAMYIILK